MDCISDALCDQPSQCSDDQSALQQYRGAAYIYLISAGFWGTPPMYIHILYGVSLISSSGEIEQIHAKALFMLFPTSYLLASSL
jgi:hypothetical protein